MIQYLVLDQTYTMKLKNKQFKLTSYIRNKAFLVKFIRFKRVLMPMRKTIKASLRAEKLNINSFTNKHFNMIKMVKNLRKRKIKKQAASLIFLRPAFKLKIKVFRAQCQK